MDSSTTIPLTRAVFARRLRELRVPRGYRTARSFARALGIDENRYTRYERAEVEPDLALLLRICEVLTITPNDLLIEAMDTRTYVSGFAESGGSGVTTSPAYVENAQLSRRTAAWRLAQFVAHLEAGGDGEPPEAPGDLQTLQRWSQLHATIDRDPFAFILTVTSDPKFTRLSGVAERKFAELVGELTAAVDAHARALRA